MQQSTGPDVLVADTGGSVSDDLAGALVDLAEVWHLPAAERRAGAEGRELQQARPPR